MSAKTHAYQDTPQVGFNPAFAHGHFKTPLPPMKAVFNVATPNTSLPQAPKTATTKPEPEP